MRGLLIVLLTFWGSGAARATSFDFYGNGESLPGLALSPERRGLPLDTKAVQALMQHVQRQFPAELPQEIAERASALNLDDIGILLYVKKYVAALHTSGSQSGMIEYLIFKTLGYDVILTYTSNRTEVFALIALEPSSSTFVYDRGKRYHLTDFASERPAGQQCLYRGGNDGGRPFYYNPALTPTLKAVQKLSNRSFRYGGSLRKLQTVSNQSLVNYLNDLPQFALGTTYLNRKLSAEAETTLLKPLADMMSGYPVSQKAAFLLQFVQQAFPYRTDQEHYGREKYNYPEETLCTDFSDCEDRALLYAFLLKELCGIPCVLLLSDSRKHACIGAAIPGYNHGYSFRYSGVKYVVCETTGNGFTPGQSAINLAEVDTVIPL